MMRDDCTDLILGSNPTDDKLDRWLQAVRDTYHLALTERDVEAALEAQVTQDTVDGHDIEKYWKMRRELFSRFDQGVILDRESLYSVTPEAISIDLARKLACDTIIDPFCGAGGNILQFAWTCKKVQCADIDVKKIVYSINNLAVYGISKNVSFTVSDFLNDTGAGAEKDAGGEAENVIFDTLFCSPPWGGPSYARKPTYILTEMPGIDYAQLINKSSRIARSAVYFLPKSTHLDEIRKFSPWRGDCYVERIHYGGHLIGIHAFHGEVVEKLMGKRKSEAGGGRG